MGAGPDRLTSAAGRLRARGIEVEEVPVEAPVGLRAEIGTSFALHRAVAAEVRRASLAGAVPLVLSLNSGSALRALAAAGGGAGGGLVVGHAGVHKSEATVGGFLVRLG